MRRIVLVLCFFLVVMSVNCDETCGDGDGVTVSSVPSGSTCQQEYNGSIRQLFGDFEIPSCNGFFTSDFSQIPVTSWRDSFAICIIEKDLSMNTVLQQKPPQQLLSARCFKNNSVLVDACECRMDCLLQFNSNVSPVGFLIYLKDIGCNESDLSTSLISAYSNASNVTPSIQLNPEYVNCPTQDLVLSSLIVPVPSSTSTGITTTSSQDPVIVTPTNTAPTCVDYDIQGFNTSAAYCQCSDSTRYTSTAYNQLLGQACNSTASSNWYFKPTTTGLALSVVQQCARDSNVAQLQQLFNLTDCSSDVGWSLTRVVCECFSQTDCPVNTLLSTDIADCVLHFTRHDQPYNTSLVFIQGLDRKSLKYYNSCLVDLQIPDCTTFPPTASTSTTVTQESTTPPVSIFERMYFQLALGVVGGALILLTLSFVMIIVVLVLKRRRNSNFYEPESKTRDECSSPQTITSETALSPVNTSSFNWGNKMATSGKTLVIPNSEYSKWKRIFARQVVQANHIEIMETIGEGAFGLVQKGLLKGKNDRCVHIAIKAMKGASTPEQVEEFVSESAIMIDFDHPNVLGLLGVCFDTDNGLPLIVLPFMSNGDLKTYLQIKRHGTPRGSIPEGLTITLLMRMCLDIAKGMAYLARRKFVHRDLAARNCMVDENLIVRVADFGLSRDVYSKDYYRLERRVKLPVKWLPPESLHDSIFNERTDVWSFGVTCWEVFSLGRTPYPSIDNADVLEYVENGFRLKKVALCPKEVYLVLSQCWDESPEIRPCFLILVESMRTIMSNWEGHDHTLRKKMETELQQSMDQDGYESDSQELDCTGSMAVGIGSRAQYPPNRTAGNGTGRKPHSQRISTSSSIGVSTMNSKTALLGNNVRSEDSESPLISATRPADFDLSTSLSDEDSRNCAVNHVYYNYTPDQCKDCDCHGSNGNLTECRHNVTRGNKFGGQSATPPSVPMFEMFYNDRLSTSSLKSNSVVQGKPNELPFRERGLEVSQSSSCGTEVTNLPDTPIDLPTMYKPLEVEPVDYCLPIRTTPQPPHFASDNPQQRREGGPLRVASRASNKSSSLINSVSSPLQDRVASISPTNHFYFTLDPTCSTPTSVFDSEASNSQNSCDTAKSPGTHKTSFNSETDNPVLAYRNSKFADFHDPLNEVTAFYPPFYDEGAINGSSPHPHMVLEHSRQKFDGELTP